MDTWNCHHCDKPIQKGEYTLLKCRHIICNDCGLDVSEQMRGGYFKNLYKCKMCHRYVENVQPNVMFEGDLIRNYQRFTHNKQDYAKTSVEPTVREDTSKWSHGAKSHAAKLTSSNHYLEHQDNKVQITGLENRKLSCAINSIVQVLAQTPGFYEAMFSDIDAETKTTELPNILMDLLLDINSGLPRPVHTEALQENIIRRSADFHFWEEHDCHSFLLCLLSALKEDLGNDSMTMFTGRLKNRFSYPDCHHTEYSSSEDFTSLCIPLDDHKNSVDEGLKSLLSQETLNSSIFCRKCEQGNKSRGRKKRCSKTLLIEKAPEILLLQLSKFKEVVSRDGLKQVEKRQCFVEYRDILNLEESSREMVSSEVTYNLYAVISHKGTTEGGHYIAYVRKLSSTNEKYVEHRDTVQNAGNLSREQTRRQGHGKGAANNLARAIDTSGDWYHCTDSDITSIKPPNGFPIHRNAYLLFYHKTS